MKVLVHFHTRFLNETAEEGSTYFVMDDKELEEPK